MFYFLTYEGSVDLDAIQDPAMVSEGCEAPQPNQACADTYSMRTWIHMGGHGAMLRAHVDCEEGSQASRCLVLACFPQVGGRGRTDRGAAAVLAASARALSLSISKSRHSHNHHNHLCSAPRSRNRYCTLARPPCSCSGAPLARTSAGRISAWFDARERMCCSAGTT